MRNLHKLKFLKLVAVTFLTLGRVRMKMLRIWMLMHQIWPRQPILGMLHLIHLNKTVAQIYLKILMYLLLHHWTTLSCFSSLRCSERLWHTQTIMPFFKRDETRAQKNDPDYVDNMWVNTSVDEMRAFFGMNLIMGINNLPMYKLYWHKDSFLGNAGIKQIMPVKRYEKLCQYLHVSDRANEPNHQGNYDKLYKNLVCAHNDTK